MRPRSRTGLVLAAVCAVAAALPDPVQQPAAKDGSTSLDATTGIESYDADGIVYAAEKSPVEDVTAVNVTADATWGVGHRLRVASATNGTSPSDPFVAREQHYAERAKAVLQRSQDDSPSGLESRGEFSVHYYQRPSSRELGEGQDAGNVKVQMKFVFAAKDAGYVPVWAYQSPLTAVGDFNGDGKADIALAGNPTWKSIPVAMASSSGTFSIITENSEGSGLFQSWAALPGMKMLSGDVDGDGTSDLYLVGAKNVSAGQRWKSVAVAKSLMNGHFDVTNVAVNHFPTFAAIPNTDVIAGDVNGDQKTDLAIKGAVGFITVPIAFSVGNGKFEAINQDVPEFAEWATLPGITMLAADFTSDGKADLLLVGGSDWVGMPLAISSGDGTFTVKNGKYSHFAALAADPSVQPLAGDFNGDGRQDVALVCAREATKLPIALGRGDGTFFITDAQINDAQFASLCRMPGAKAYVGDFNGDKKSDVALLGARGWEQIPIIYSDATLDNVPTTAKMATSLPRLPACADEDAYKAVCPAKKSLCSDATLGKTLRKRCPKTCGMCLTDLDHVHPNDDTAIVPARGAGSFRCHPKSPYATNVACTKSFMQYQEHQVTPKQFLVGQCSLSKVTECSQCGKGNPATMCDSPADAWKCFTTKRSTCVGGCILEGTGISYRAYHSKDPCNKDQASILRDFDLAISYGLNVTVMDWRVTDAPCNILRMRYQPESMSQHVFCERALFML